MFFFFLWNTNGGIRQNVQAALFNTMKVDGDKKRTKMLIENIKLSICILHYIPNPLKSYDSLWEDETVIIH